MKTLLKNVNLLDGTKDMHLRQGVNILIEDGKFKKITTDNIDYAQSLTEQIQVRRNLLIQGGILTNPYNLQ